MLQRKFGRLHVFVGRNRHLIGPELCSSRSAAGKFCNPNFQTSPRIGIRITTAATASLASRTAISTKACTAMHSPAQSNSTAAAGSARPGVGNQGVSAPKTAAAQPQGAASEPTTGASISWPGGVNRDSGGIAAHSRQSRNDASGQRASNAEQYPAGR